MLVIQKYKQGETQMQENYQDMPNAENFKKAFKPYLIKWSIVYAVFITFITFIVVSITVRSWGFSQLLISWLIEMGAVLDGKNIQYSVITLGALTLGIFTLGSFSIGIITMGINIIGGFAIGVNSIGIIAIGTNAVGVIAIGVNAVGVVAIGVNVIGFYALSYSEYGKGRYLLAPHRQDAEAIDFFSRWFPKLTASISSQ